MHQPRQWCVLLQRRPGTVRGRAAASPAPSSKSHYGGSEGLLRVETRLPSQPGIRCRIGGLLTGGRVRNIEPAGALALSRPSKMN
jgi:hypothetical protein